MHLWNLSLTICFLFSCSRQRNWKVNTFRFLKIRLFCKCFAFHQVGKLSEQTWKHPIYILSGPSISVCKKVHKTFPQKADKFSPILVCGVKFAAMKSAQQTTKSLLHAIASLQTTQKNDTRMHIHTHTHTHTHRHTFHAEFVIFKTCRYVRQKIRKKCMKCTCKSLESAASVSWAVVCCTSKSSVRLAAVWLSVEEDLGGRLPGQEWNPRPKRASIYTHPQGGWSVPLDFQPRTPVIGRRPLWRHFLVTLGPLASKRRCFWRERVKFASG